MSAAPFFKKGDYVAISHKLSVPNRYNNLKNYVFQVESYIEDEDNYNYVLSIVEGALNKEISKMKVVIPECYLSLLNKTQREPDVETLKNFGLIEK